MATHTAQKPNNRQLLKMSGYLIDSLQRQQNKKALATTEQMPKRSHKTIEKLFANFTDTYVPCEIDWGKPMGREGREYDQNKKEPS